MMEIIKGYIASCGVIVLVLIIGAIVKSNKNIDNNIPRKIVHIGVALSWFPMYKYFGTTIHILAIPIAFFIVNILSNKVNIFSSIPLLADNRDDGTYLYPLSLIIMSTITLIIPEFYPAYGIGLFSMAFGDGLASIVGNTINGKKYHIFGATKSLAGCLTVFLLSSLVAFLFPLIFNLEMNIVHAIIIGIIGMILEILGGKKIDNITLPIGVSILAYIFLVVI